MTGDYHVHTFFSPCADARMSYHNILDAAEAAGLEEIGLTDHPFHDGLAEHHEHLFLARRRTASRARVWIGAELEVVGPGRLALSRKQLPRADYLIASPSHYDVERHPPVAHLNRPDEWAERMIADMENVPGSEASVIAHPFFVYALLVAAPNGAVRLPGIADIVNAMSPRRLAIMLEKLAAARLALEISPRIGFTPAFTLFMEYLYNEARKYNMRFSLGSDSHRPPTIGRLGAAQVFADRLGLRPEEIWRPDAA